MAEDVPMKEDIQPDEIIDYLINCENVYYKSQQRGDEEPSSEEKKQIANDILIKSKSGFLARFGKHLQSDHLEYFEQFVTDQEDGYAVSYYLNDLKRQHNKRAKDIKNRRYDALKKLIEQNSYFSETEMMRRNPLLYNHLVGQYLSDDEKKKRDNIDTKNITFVNLLLESIDRDNVRKLQKKQQDEEDKSDQEIDSDNEVEPNKDTFNDSCNEEISRSFKWGEFEPQQTTYQPQHQLFTYEEPKSEPVMINATERKLLKEEFFSIMYQNFLDGKDTEFDYSSVDNNDEYDNLDIKTHDAEDSYFDSETPENISPEDVKMICTKDASEDELDAFMDRINQHHSLKKLSDDLSKL